MPLKQISKDEKERFSNIFLLVILIFILYLSYLIFKPFIKEIVISGILVTIFYPLYLKFVYWTKGKITFSALIVCLLILLIVIVPFSFLIFYLAQKALLLYTSLSPNLSNEIIQFFNTQIWPKSSLVDKNIFDIQQFIIDSISTIKRFLITGATSLVKSTTQFFASLVIIIFTMFFMFHDGRAFLRRLMRLTPLSNKYDKLIWMKFRDMSFTTIVATFVTSLAQAVSGAIGFMIVGLPGLLIGVLIFIFSFLPYIGTAFVWLPIAIYFLIVGKIWQGIFILLWGSIVISLIDNFLRPYIIKDKAEVHPLIIFFSIFGGLILMGFWGMVFGPLIVALAFTILHIYELEYEQLLER